MESLLSFEKLLPSPYGEDVAEALRCEIRDPLWLLARQWQLGEFKAEDAGTAAAAHIVAQSTPIQRLETPTGAIQTVDNNTLLNAMVERRPPVFDLQMRLETGREWRRMLTQAGKTAAWEVFRQNPLLHFKAPAPAFEPDNLEITLFDLEPYAQLVAAVGNGRMVDGLLLFEQLAERKASVFLPQADSIVNDLGEKWVKQVQKRLQLDIAGTNQEGAWDASRLEYRFSVAAAKANGTALCLKNPEHHGRDMDWPDFKQVEGSAAIKQDLDAKRAGEHRRTYLPSPVSFPGMPRARWWEMEDSTMDLSNVQTAKTDTGLLLLTEFSLLFSNDWLLIPYSVPIGHLAKVNNLKVTDVFGVLSVVNSVYAGQAQAGNWELFQTNDDGVPTDWLLAPAAHARWLQSEPVEEVHFLRDEMANMVWAVEKTVPDGIGSGTMGQTAAAHWENTLLQLAGEPTQPLPAAQQNDAQHKYRLGTAVPPNWIPFIPVRTDANKPDMNLRRATMPRLIDGQSPSRIRPRTQLLRAAATNGNFYDLREEEIPVTGITVRAVWRRARGYDGSVTTWLAFEKTQGRYFQASGLVFDQL